MTITSQQRAILHVLADATGPLRYSDLDQARGTKYPTSRDHFLKLKQAGLVCNIAGRHQSLRITVEGREAIREESE